MKDGYADITVLVDVGVPDVVDDSQLWRPQRVLFGENQVAFEEPALVQRVRWPNDQHLKRRKKFEIIFEPRKRGRGWNIVYESLVHGQSYSQKVNNQYL